eukprot:632597-Pleurochrysis_carterae.AAC.1
MAPWDGAAGEMGGGQREVRKGEQREGREESARRVEEEWKGSRKRRKIIMRASIRDKELEER